MLGFLAVGTGERRGEKEGRKAKATVGSFSAADSSLEMAKDPSTPLGQGFREPVKLSRKRTRAHLH